MPDIALCPSCNASLKVPAEVWHNQVRCPKCATVFRPSEGHNQAITAAPSPPPLYPPPTSGGITETPLPTSPEAWDEEPPSPRRRRSHDDRDLYADKAPRPLAFLKGRGVGAAAIVMLFLTVIVELLMGTGLEIYTYTWLRGAGNRGLQVDQLHFLEIITLLAALLHFSFFTATAIVFLIWFHAAYANLKLLRVYHLEYSPGWAVGFFFIPFLNLVRPYQIAQEIWKGSAPPTFGEQSPRAWKARSGSPLILVWWLCWLLGNLLAQAGLRGNMAKDVSAEGLAILAGIGISASLFYITAAILLIFIIKRITRNQEAKWAQLQEEPADPDWVD